MIQIAKQFYEKHSISYDIYICSNKSGVLGEIVNDVMKNVESSTKLIKRNPSVFARLNQSAFLLFRKEICFKEFLKNSKISSHFPKDFQFIIYVNEKINFTEFLSLKFKIFAQSSIIIESVDKIDLAAVKIDKNSNCEWRLVIINSFLASTETWKNSKFFENFAESFQGCELNILSQAPKFKAYRHNTKWSQHETIEYGNRLLEILCKSLGFQCIFLESSNFGRRQYNDHMFVSVLPIRMVGSQIEADKFTEHVIKGTATIPFTTLEVLIVLPQRSPYTQWQKNVLPFEEELWIWLIAVNTSIFVIILIIKRTPRLVRNFVFGENMKTPILNFV